MAGALWSCQGEGTSFPGEGTPVPLTFTGAFCWEASQAQVKTGTILTWDSTQHDPRLPAERWEARTPSCNNRCWEILPAAWNGSIISTHETQTNNKKTRSDRSQNTFSIPNKNIDWMPRALILLPFRYYFQMSVKKSFC